MEDLTNLEIFLLIFALVGPTLGNMMAWRHIRRVTKQRDEWKEKAIANEKWLKARRKLEDQNT